MRQTLGIVIGSQMEEAPRYCRITITPPKAPAMSMRSTDLVLCVGGHTHHCRLTQPANDRQGAKYVIVHHLKSLTQTQRSTPGGISRIACVHYTGDRAKVAPSMTAVGALTRMIDLLECRYHVSLVFCSHAVCCQCQAAVDNRLSALSVADHMHVMTSSFASTSRAMQGLGPRIGPPC